MDSRRFAITFVIFAFTALFIALLFASQNFGDKSFKSRHKALDSIVASSLTRLSNMTTGKAADAAPSGAPLKLSFLQTSGKPPMCLCPFDANLLSNNLDSVTERSKFAILQSSLGAKGFRICTDLCLELDIFYAVNIHRFERGVEPAHSRILSKAQFYQRTQQPGENCAQFTTALRALATKCGYSESQVSELVRDRLVAACNEKRIRERLIIQISDDLTFKRAIYLAQSLEQA